MGPKTPEARRGSVSLSSVTTVSEMKSLDMSEGPKMTALPFSGGKERGESFVMSGVDNTSHSGGRVRAVGLRDGLIWESV